MSLKSSLDNATNIGNNIVDTVNGMTNKFKINDFMEIKEDLSPELQKTIDTVILNLKNILGKVAGFIKGLIDKIKRILALILSLFDLEALFDSLGLSGLLKFLFNFILKGLGLDGFALAVKRDLAKLFKDICGSFDDNLNSHFANGLVLPHLAFMSIFSILLALACAGVENAFSTAHSMFSNNDKMKELKSEYDNKITTASMQNDTNKVTSLQNEYNAKKDEVMKPINQMFKLAIVPFLNKNKSPDKLNTLKDINSTGVNQNVKAIRPTVGNVVLSSLDKSTSNKHVDFDEVDNVVRTFDDKYDQDKNGYNLSKIKNHKYLVTASRNKALGRTVKPDVNSNTITTSSDNYILNLL